MDEVVSVGWTRFKKKNPGISDLDIKGVFRLGKNKSFLVNVVCVNYSLVK